MNYELKSTGQYDKWFPKLKDASAKIKILARLSHIENGNFGDHKQIDTTLYELRFFSVPDIGFTTQSMEPPLCCWPVAINPPSRKIYGQPKTCLKKWRNKK